LLLYQQPTTLAALPAANRPPAALPVAITVYKVELCSLEYNPIASTVLLPELDNNSADMPAIST